MKGLSDFWAMGGYGLYVWSAYGVSALVLMFNAWSARARERRLLHGLATSSSSVPTS
jgi:heme exporter protein D